MASPTSTKLGERLFVAAIGVALVPIVVATARAIAGDWVPVGDNGLVYVRTTDVFSADPPLLSTWSFGSTFVEEDFNHPGALMYDLLAAPTALFGPVGLVVGTALLNVASVVGIALVARWVGGLLAGVAALAAVAVLCATLGSELLFDPWTPNSLVLPMLLVLLLAWAVAAGRVAALPWFAVLGSLLLETNLAYASIVPVLALWSLLSLTLRLRRQKREDSAGWPSVWRRAQRLALISTAIVLIAWAQPLVEQFTSEGTGNLTRIARGLSSTQRTLGLDGALRLFGTVLATWWRPSSIGEAYRSPSSLIAAAVTVGLFVGALSACIWHGRKRSDRVVLTAAVGAVLTVVLAVATASRAPVNATGSLSPYQTRVLWPLAAFVYVATAVGVVRRLRRQRWSMYLGGALLAVVVFVSLSNLTHADRPYGTHEPSWTHEIARDLNGQLDDLEAAGTLHFQWRADSFNYQFFWAAVLAEIDRRDIPFTVQDTFLVRTLGEHRRFDGRNADAVLRVRTGGGARTTRRGERRTAFHEGLAAYEGKELATLMDQIENYIDTDRFRLTREGQAALERLNKNRPSSTEGDLSAEHLLGENRPLVSLMRLGFVELDDRWDRRFRRYVELQVHSDERTVGVFVVAMPG